MTKPTTKIQAVDLFCGIGGLTYGLREAGIDVRAGVDNDGSCRDGYVRNNKGAKFIDMDIRDVTGGKIREYYEGADVRVLVGCAPCQPFSIHRNKRKMSEPSVQDANFGLLLEVARLAEEGNPDIISVENVPGLQKESVYAEFLQRLEKLGFHDIVTETVFCPEYGIPQTRTRLVMLASKLGKIGLKAKPYPTQKEWQAVATVAHYLKGVAKLEAGGRCKTDPYHVTQRLSRKNLQRIMQSAPGGNWQDWDAELVPACRTRSAYNAPYGRMEWGKPAPTITTQFSGYTCGRFGHPEENRAISLREGGLLQTFHEKYKFHGEGQPISIGRIARHIGNAVPVKLAQHIGESIVEHANEHR